MVEQCVIHGTFKESIMNVLKGKCLRLFERDEDSGVLTHRSCQKKAEEDMAYCPHYGAVHAHLLSRGCVCLHMLWWMWTAQPSLVITHIPQVRGKTEPRDDTADLTISLSPAVNSSLARHRAYIPLP